jgi:hypothetical protein
VSDKPKYTQAQYLEANRLHRDGFMGVSSKYRRVTAPPLLPPDSELLSYLKEIAPRAYEEVKRTITLQIARVIGDRHCHLDQGTYHAIKAIEREELTGAVADLDSTTRRHEHERILEIRYADPSRATVRRKVYVPNRGDEFMAVSAVMSEELTRFEDVTFEDRHNFDMAVHFLKKKGIEVVILKDEVPYGFPS